MPSSDLFNEIGRLFSSSDSVPVLAALRQEPLVWQGLERPEFLQLAVERAGSQARYWCPGRLALLALGDPRPMDALRAEPMALLGPGLQELALQAYQNFQRTGQPPATLRDGALLALTLRERRRLTGTWSGMLQEILPRSGQPDAIWRAPLAILYGLIPDPDEMLRSLLVKNAPSAAYEWAIHAQLSQPVRESEHVQVFSRLLQGLPVPAQLNLLRGLSLRGRESLAASLADRLLIGNPAFTSLRAPTGVITQDLAGLSSRALAMQQMGSFYQLSGDDSQALSLLSAAQSVLEQWLAGLHLQRLSLQVKANDHGTGPLVESELPTQLAMASGWLKEELGAVLVSHPYASSVIDQVAPGADSAFLQLKRAAIMVEREPAVARDLARQGAAGLVETIRTHGMPFNGDFVYTWRPQDALRILLQLDLREEALSLALSLLDVRPVDANLLYETANIYTGLGRLDAAILCATSAVALEPSNAAWRRALGDLWGKAERWENAYHEWEVVLTLEGTTFDDDVLACAQTALRAGRAVRAVELCEIVLQDDPNKGVALGLLGQALIAQGKLEEAVSYLVRATLLTPENLAPWLALAKLQADMGETHRSVETLRAAVTAVPDAAEGHLVLAEALVSAGMLADALPHLKKAAILANGEPAPVAARSALMYGKTLRRLGHTAEARAVLERARSLWCTFPELAYEYTLTMIDLGEGESALPILEAALRNGLAVLEGHLLYVRILLGDYLTSAEELSTEARSTRMYQAETALNHILELEPENLEARFLQADILRERGSLVQAMEVYRSLADVEDPGTQELRWRIQWGLSRTALRLGETGIALAAIKEACQARPDSLSLQRALAEVSLKANLPQEAVEAAENALQMVPGDVDNLAWFANFVASFGETEKAAEALEQALQIAPQRADLLVTLAHWQLSSGDLAATRASLEKLKEMENTGRADLRRAAQIYLRLEDPEEALACFECALRIEPEVPADLLYEVAQLYERTGNPEAALELTQRALDATPDNLSIALLHTDLLARLKRPQAALALLERMLRIAEGRGEETLTSERRRMIGEIHERFTRLLIEGGNLAAALDHAERAFSLNPELPGRCYRAADLALALLQDDRAQRTVRSMASWEGPLPMALLDMGPDGLEMFSLRVELALTGSNEDDAGYWIQEGLNRETQYPRLIAARARLLARQGDLAEGRDYFQAAQKALRKEKKQPTTPLWLAEAALDMEYWREAEALFEDCIQRNENDARAYLGLARAVVMNAERQRLCAALHCVSNAPGADALGEVSRQKFEEAIHTAGKRSSAGEIGKWQVRGNLAFSPSAQNVRSLAAMPIQPEDTAALVAGLRVVGNRGAALQLAHRHANSPAVSMQIAACYLDDSSDEAIAAAEQAVAANPQNPLSHAAMALIWNNCEEYSRALEEFENALSIWPGEAEWHDLAGDLSIQLGNIQTGIMHRQQAVLIDSNNARYAFKLGQTCLVDDNVAEAIVCLEKSCAMDAGQADAWLTLAQCYNIAGRLAQALEAAKKAGELKPTSAEGLLVAGETALAMGQPDQAFEFARGAIRREPESAAAVLFLSNVLVLLNRVSEGLAVLEAASPAVKAIFPVAFERAKLINRLHGPKAALEILEKLAREFPEEPDLLGFLARTQAECGDEQSAERYAFKSLRLDPDQPDLTLMLGRLQRKSGQLDQSVHLLSEVIRMTPDNLEAYIELGSVYQERREFDLAMQVYRQAMQIAPKDYQAYYQCGLIQRDSKDYSASEAFLRKAAELAPDNLSIRRQLVGVITLNLVHNKQEASVQ